MELTILGVVILGLAGVLAYDWVSQQGHVRQIAGRWQAAGERIEIAPVGVICHGDRPSATRDPRVLGTLGMANGDFVFLGQRDSTYDLTIPAAAIRWIGVRTEVAHSWNHRTETQTLILHLDTPPGWRVYTFTQGKPGRLMGQIAAQVAAQTGLLVHEMDEIYEDYGPAAAIRLIRDEAGQWARADAQPLDLGHLPPNWDGLTHTLYLAPDRLIFDWREVVPLAELRRVSVETGDTVRALKAGGVDLLRLELGGPDGAAREVGFLVDRAWDWADEIEAQRAGLTGS